MDYLWSSLPHDHRPHRVAKTIGWNHRSMAPNSNRRAIPRLVRHLRSDALWLEHLELAAETALSLALRELFAVVLVDRFYLTFDASHRLLISMTFRSPLCYTELATDAEPRDIELAAETMVENQVALAVIGLVGAAQNANVHAAVNRQDQLICSFTARTPVPSDGLLPRHGNGAEERGTGDSVAPGSPH